MKKIVNRRNYVCVIKLFSPLCILVLADWSRRTRHNGAKIFLSSHPNYSSNEHIFIILFQYHKVMLLLLEFQSEFLLETKFRREKLKQIRYKMQ